MNKTIPELIKKARDELLLSQTDLAERIGVTRLTVTRWENGDAAPAPLAIKNLLNVINGTSVHNELTDNLSRFDNADPSTSQDFLYGKHTWEVLPAPYVINGPEDQEHFNNLLISMQSTKSPTVSPDIYKKRLSMVDSVDGTKTSQSLLEKRIKSSKSWSSNYGPHGWHRYVGRFPSHLVRTLINHFQADSDDIILDPFAGSGTTLVEARMLGVPSIGIEVCSLSNLISRTKAGFPIDGADLIKKTIPMLEEYYQKEWDVFLKKYGNSFSHADVISRPKNKVEVFPNIEKWFTPGALLGTSLVVEYADTQKGFTKDSVLLALSAKMRSIGNLDVDVIRAEYSKKPRENVDVLKLVKRQLMNMANGIESTISSHQGIMSKEPNIKMIEGSVLDAKIKKESVSYIITSPPYGVESLSYLRTHLLSYRALSKDLGTNPYDFSDKIIGSEYLAKKEISTEKLKIHKVSKTCVSFFDSLAENVDKKNKIRVNMMIHFFEDMNSVVEKFNYWLKKGGKVAFIVGNKRIGNDLIPTHTIMQEIFEHNGFSLETSIEHKLKTNNSNSKVPWQDRIINEEFVLIFRKDT